MTYVKKTYKGTNNINRTKKLLDFVNQNEGTQYNLASVGVHVTTCSYNNKKNINNELFGFYTRTGQGTGYRTLDEKRQMLKDVKRTSKF